MSEAIPGTVDLPVAKRIFDVAVSIVLLILASPFMLLIIFSMVVEGILDSAARGSLFYSEIRISQGHPFNLYKFRIFKMSSLKAAWYRDHFIHTKALEQDSANLTRVGRILKQSYMDELPQLFNVLLGDMTLVGPRPTNAENASKWLQERKYSKQIFKAGLPGYFQSHKGLKLKQNQDEIDMQYIEFCQIASGYEILWYDVKILLLSLLTVLRREGV
jgi:lipopolysaccharide/colanic/teichoic acid biosynthesis glycosyltransferase